MKRFLTLALLSLMTLAISITINAQGVFTPQSAEAGIAFPPPVYVLRGKAEIYGTANEPNMQSYFLEFRALNDDLSSANESVRWLPATLPSREVVNDDVLGVWDTSLLPDGLYELRLTINIARQSPVLYVVSPLRIANDPSPYVTEPTHTATPVPFVQATATRTILRPTLGATPTAEAGNPIVTAVTDANVRAGDTTTTAVIGSLLTGQTAQLLGRSNTGTGWFYIQLNNGRRGFIAPGLVNVSGDISSLTPIIPPATPTPTFTPTPPTTGDLILNGNSTVPDRPRCNEQFEVQLNVANIGANATTAGFVVRIENQHIASGTVTSVASNVVPISIAPGGNYVVVIPITVSSYPGEDHRINATVDYNNQVLEENESNNYYSFTYRLRSGTCS